MRGSLALELGDWEIAEDLSELIEVIAVLTIGITVIIALVSGAIAWYRSTASMAMETVKRQIGRGLLLGLDLLIAADVIRTVTLQPTLENVGALGLLVLVRTFLAWSLVVELSGRWPWQRDVELQRDDERERDTHEHQMPPEEHQSGRPG